MKHATLVACVFLSMSAPAQAAWLHLCPAVAAPAGAPQAALPGPGAMRAVVAGVAELAGCRGVPLGTGAAQVEAIYPLPAADVPGSVILLQGVAGERFAPNSHTLPVPGAPAPAPAPMPLNTNLLAAASVRAFGREERVRVEHGEAGLQLSCRAGMRAAGVLVTGPWYLPRAQLAVRARFSGDGAFRVQVADTQDAAREHAHDLGKLGAVSGKSTLAMPMPAGLDRARWRQFVIQCPPHAASLVLDSLALEPVPGSPGRRATWIWEAARWQAGGALLDWAGREGIGELFIVVPLQEGRVREPAALAAFVQRAHAAGISVSSVDGDPHMVLPEQHGATIRRARAYAAYNASAAPEARLRAIQFDIEPYLLPANTIAPPEADRQYMALARALRRAAGKTTLEFVVPYWWSEKPELLAALAGAADGLAVMDYRTDPDEIVRFGVPFLDWAAHHGKRVHIALEAGPVAPETQRRYVRAPSGEAGSLVVAEAGGHRILVLLRAPAAVPGAAVYRLEGERVFDGSATSFHGDQARLRDLLPRLERDFSAWPGFAGVALHEWR
ncbi:hypothetical protein [Massilia niabensis]|uniref:DUF4434 domain-containing protein n=1 Tax=Massilia niabensis TaxID=544910 RepID=A0ABW0LCK5_9BURK